MTDAQLHGNTTPLFKSSSSDILIVDPEDALHLLVAFPSKGFKVVGQIVRHPIEHGRLKGGAGFHPFEPVGNPRQTTFPHA